MSIQISELPDEQINDSDCNGERIVVLKRVILVYSGHSSEISYISLRKFCFDLALIWRLIFQNGKILKIIPLN